MVVFYKYIYTELLLCRSSWGPMLQFRTHCFLCPTVYPGLAGVGIMLPVVRPQSGGKGHRHIYSSCSFHRPSSLHKGLSLFRILSVGAENTGLWWHWFNSAWIALTKLFSSICFDDFGNRTPLWFSFLFLSLGDWRLGVEINPLSSQSQKQLIQCLGKRRSSGMRKETTLRIFPWENELGAPFSFVKRFLSLCSLALSTQMPISFCLAACQTLELKLGEICVSKNLNSWLDEAVPCNYYFPSSHSTCPSLLPAYPAWCARDGIESPVYIPKKTPGTPKASPITDEVSSWSDLNTFIL